MASVNMDVPLGPKLNVAMPSSWVELLSQAVTTAKTCILQKKRMSRTKQLSGQRLQLAHHVRQSCLMHHLHGLLPCPLLPKVTILFSHTTNLS